MRSPLRRFVPFLAVCALALSACSEDISSREIMVETLEDQGALTAEQAECVTVKLFDSGDYLQEQLDEVASGFVNDDGTEKVKGFEAAASTAIDDCIRQ